MLTTFGPVPLGVASSIVAPIAPPVPTLTDYALVTSGIVLNAATAIRITEPAP